MQHVTVYRQEDRWAAVPANYGIWSWGDEIVVGFVVGYYKRGVWTHACDNSRPFVTMQARSLDGGRTWQARKTPCRTPGNRALSADEHVLPELGVGRALELGLENAPVESPGGINFAHPDFALMCARTGLGAGTVSWFYTSYNRCRTWDGPFSLPTFGQPGVEARTDYLVAGPDVCTLFLTAAKSNGKEGRVFCARTTDGGRTFAFLSWIGPEPEGYHIMPVSVRLAGPRILVAVRCQGGSRADCWINLYASGDDGASWEYVNRPVANTGMSGNPPTLIKLQDGRLCLTYGYRDAPCGIRAKLSNDDGRTWGEEIVLRDDAGNWDIGYPRTVQREDGTVVTVYWFNDHPEGERYIAATLWKP